MSQLQQAKFFTTVNHLRDLPNTSVPEVAFAGRSNAGKSTAINILCNQKRLAFASRTPGRTQHINYFDISNKLGTLGYLVDLPGYGYAEVGGSAKAHWGMLLSEYVQTRPQLAGLILMMDARRPFTDLDSQMVEWYLPMCRPLHVLLTKADKLSRSEAAQALALTRRTLAAYQEQLTAPVVLSTQLFSSLKRVGLEEATDKISDWLALPKKTPGLPPSAPSSAAAIDGD